MGTPPTCVRHIEGGGEDSIREGDRLVQIVEVYADQGELALLLHDCCVDNDALRGGGGRAGCGGASSDVACVKSNIVGLAVRRCIDTPPVDTKWLPPRASSTNTSTRRRDDAPTKLAPGEEDHTVLGPPPPPLDDDDDNEDSGNGGLPAAVAALEPSEPSSSPPPPRAGEGGGDQPEVGGGGRMTPTMMTWAMSLSFYLLLLLFVSFSFSFSPFSYRLFANCQEVARKSP